MEHLNRRLINWASILEDNTREQAEATSAMPFIHPHVALMPDAHLGKGATVGSVIPTLGAIIPAAVGVDIGCVDADTEYLSRSGWRRIADWNGEDVMQYDPATGAGRFVQPQSYIVKGCPEMLRLHTKYGIDQVLSPDHRVLLWKIVGRDRRREPVVMTAEEFETEHARLAQGFKAEFETTFTPEIVTKLPLSDGELRVQVMVHADAHVSATSARLHLQKTRKIKRARTLLTDAGIDYTETEHADGAHSLRFTPPRATKSYDGDWWTASNSQLAIVAEEVLHWDGNEDASCYYTRDRASADFIHYAFTATGRRGVLRADVAADGAADYRVFAHANTRVGMAGVPKTPVERVPSPDGKAYCFTVPTGFWVMRRGGNIAMTGNCGMSAVRTQWTREQILARGSLTPLREAIERAIPLSAGKYNNKVVETAAPRLEELHRLADEARFAPEDYAGNWPLQLGSLGSGNHFIEITVDETDRVWAFLHSGSRGIGNKIAQRHIKVAADLCRRWWINLPDPDLAYLVEHTAEFDRYIAELRWAQHFALLNRDEMMDRTLRQLAEHMDEPITEVERVSCHHNYTSRERHFGKDVWLSRKGAIDASAGTPGLIPGSMGTASYVVTGLGNPLSLNSSPHGAGRVYSRSKARKTFTGEQLREAMAGIEYRDSDAFLDEHPGAYKDVDVVMADAKDLVAVEHTLRQIVNVKGA